MTPRQCPKCHRVPVIGGEPCCEWFVVCCDFASKIEPQPTERAMIWEWNYRVAKAHGDNRKYLPSASTIRDKARKTSLVAPGSTQRS